MGGMTLRQVADILGDIDFVMLNSHAEGGRIAGRPMSNSRDVEWDGDSWFFVDDGSRTLAEVSRDPKVTLTVHGAKGLFGKPSLFLSIEGTVEIVRDKAVFAAHWTSEIERWWPGGPNSEGLALLKVRATRINYWDGEDQGEVAV